MLGCEDIEIHQKLLVVESSQCSGVDRCKESLE